MMSSGEVFFPFIPDIMRDLVTVSTISTKINLTQGVAHPEWSEVTPAG